MDNVYFVSLGCPKNLVDSQVMLGLLEKDRYQIVQDPGQAEIIIVNTCSFIDAAKEESVDTILEMAEYKQTGSCQALVVSGCLVQRYADQLKKELPEVDLMIGTGQYHRIVELLQKPNPLERAYVDQPAFIHTENDPRKQTGPTYSAFLKVSEGCNRRCAFCIIPKLRGNVRSRTISSLVTEAEQLAQRGVKELNLVAQDLTEYGMEWKYRENLEKLLPALCQVDGIEWIRLHYIYPDQFSEELIDIFANEKKIVKYLDMPIQHTNDEILIRMNRRLTKKRLFALVEKLRARVPEVVFRTSIIVGFPGETDEQFEELCQDLKFLDLDHVGVFRYSNEEGTKATDMPNQVPFRVRKTRESYLRKKLEGQSEKRNQRYVDQTVPVLLEGVSDESEMLLQGRMPFQAQEIDGQVLLNDIDEAILPKLRPGQIVPVQITQAMPHDLMGRVVLQ